MFALGDKIINLKNNKEAIIIKSSGIEFSNKCRLEKKIPLVYCIQYNDNSIDYVFENFLEESIEDTDFRISKKLRAAKC